MLLGFRSLLEAEAGSTTSGSLSQTLEALTASGNTTVTVAASVAKTLGTLTATDTGTIRVSGSLAKTLGTLTAAGNATVRVSSSLGKTLGTLTGAGTGAVRVSASLSKTLGALAVSGTGAGAASGSLAKTLGALTSSGSGTVRVSASFVQTLSAVVASGTSTVRVAGSVTKTLGALVGAESSAVVVAGSLSQTLGTLTCAGIVTQGAGETTPETAPEAQIYRQGGVSRRRRDPREVAEEQRKSRIAALRDAYTFVHKARRHLSQPTLKALRRALERGLEPNERYDGLPELDRVDWAWLSAVPADADRLLALLADAGDEAEAGLARERKAKRSETVGNGRKWSETAGKSETPTFGTIPKLIQEPVPGPFEIEDEIAAATAKRSRAVAAEKARALQAQLQEQALQRQILQARLQDDDDAATMLLLAA